MLQHFFKKSFSFQYYYHDLCRYYEKNRFAKGSLVRSTHLFKTNQNGAKASPTLSQQCNNSQSHSSSSWWTAVPIAGSAHLKRDAGLLVEVNPRDDSSTFLLHIKDAAAVGRPDQVYSVADKTGRSALEEEGEVKEKNKQKKTLMKQLFFFQGNPFLLKHTIERMLSPWLNNLKFN